MASTEVGGSLARFFNWVRQLWFENITVRKQEVWWQDDPDLRLLRIPDDHDYLNRSPEKNHIVDGGIVYRNRPDLTYDQLNPRCDIGTCSAAPTKLIFSYLEEHHPNGYVIYACESHEADVREEWWNHPLYPYFARAKRAKAGAKLVHE